MDDLGLNKIFAAVLATALGVMAVRELPHLLMHAEMPATPAYSVGPIVEEGPSDAEPVPFPSGAFLEAMNAERGAKVFKKCTSCHNADNGGANGTGPNLYDIVGNSAALKDGFKYSSALAGADLNWDYETLDGFLAKPTRYLSGTNMNFIGLKKEADRAAVIEYLRLQSDTPVAQPVVAVPVSVEETVVETIIDAPDGMIDDLNDQVETTGEVIKEIIEETVEENTPD